MTAYFYRTKYIDYTNKLLLEEPAHIIYRFAHNRLEAVYGQIILENAAPARLNAWMAHLEQPISAAMPDAPRFVIEGNYLYQRHKADIPVCYGVLYNKLFVVTTFGFKQQNTYRIMDQQPLRGQDTHIRKLQ